MRIYDWIVIIGFVVLFGWCVIVNNKYNSLQKDYELLKINKEDVIDSLNKENSKTQNTIKVLKDSLKTIDMTITHIQNKTEEIKKEEFVVSINLTESANLLKKNLSCTEL